MKIRDDMKSKNSPGNIRIIQLTEENIPSCHVYMEARIFTPDSKRFILHRSAGPHGSARDDPEHRFFVCDIENGCKLSPVTHETGATAPSVSPDGKYLYYFVNETEVGGGRLALKRVGMDGTGRSEMLVLDSPVPGVKAYASRIYPLSSISSDGKRLALGCFLGDGRTDTAPFGLLVFNLETGEISLPLLGGSWRNPHPQYSRSVEPEESFDIMVQENHGDTYDRFGNVKEVDRLKRDIHVIKDDGSGLRAMPWGRDEAEMCQGHQCWRGRTSLAIAGTYGSETRAGLVQGRAIKHDGHPGMRAPGAYRNDLTRGFELPRFYHFAADITGSIVISDGSADVPASELGEGRKLKMEQIYIAGLPDETDGVLENFTFLLHSGSSLRAHTHPFLSPDGSKAFFNSDESGRLQAYMIEGLVPGDYTRKK